MRVSAVGKRSSRGDNVSVGAPRDANLEHAAIVSGAGSARFPYRSYAGNSAAWVATATAIDGVTSSLTPVLPGSANSRSSALCLSRRARYPGRLATSGTLVHPAGSAGALTESKLSAKTLAL